MFVSAYTGLGEAAVTSIGVAAPLKPVPEASMHTEFSAKYMETTHSGSNDKSTIFGSTVPKKPSHLSIT